MASAGAGLCDHYATLDVPRTADAAAIRSAYRRCALQSHPDKGGSHEKFRAVVAAFEVLSNDKERAAHDKALAEREAGPRESALAQLERLLRATPDDERRKVLGSLSPEAQAALAAWMKCRKTSAPSSSSSTPPTALPSPAAPSSVSAPGRAPKGVYKISSRWHASVYFLNMEMFSAPVKSLEEALSLHTALVCIRAALVSKPIDPSEPIENTAVRVKGVIAESCSAAGIDEQALGAVFQTKIYAGEWVARQIYGGKTRDFARAWKQRVDLLGAKAQGWASLRKVWVRLLVDDKGRTVAEAEAEVDKAWDEHAMHRAQVTATAERRELEAAFKPRPAKKAETPEQKRSKEIAKFVKALEDATFDETDPSEAKKARRR